MGLLSVFFGTPQSLYAGYAILAAIIVICITILLNGTDISMGNRFLLMFFVILTLIPTIFLVLFEITCMVTGGSKNQRWWCWLYAWIVSAFIIVYCIFIIIISFMSLFNYNNAITKVNTHEQENKMSIDKSNDYAKTVIENTNAIEKFMAEQSQPPLDLNIPSVPETSSTESSDMPKKIPMTPSTATSTPYDERTVRMLKADEEAEKKARSNGMMTGASISPFTNMDNGNGGIESFNNMDKFSPLF
jgi:hypothetical protein